MTETGLQAEALPVEPATVAPERDLFDKFAPLIAERQALLDSGVRDPFGEAAVELHSGGVSHGADSLGDAREIGGVEHDDRRILALFEQLGGARLVARAGGDHDHRACLARAGLGAGAVLASRLGRQPARDEKSFEPSHYDDKPPGSR